jgi:hypothetical protein
MAADKGPTSERFEGPTAAGGAYTVIHYQDASGAPTSREWAVQAEIVEYDEAGNEVRRTYGTMTPRKDT